MIAIVYPQFYGIGGIARYLDSFLSNLPPQASPPILITGDEFRSAGCYPLVEILHVPFTSNRLNLFIWGLRVRHLLRDLHRQGRIRSVNLHWPPLIPGLFLPREIPLVLTAHTTYLGMSGRFYETRHFDSQWSGAALWVKMWMEHRILAKTQKVISLTEQGRQEVLSYGFKNVIAVIPNGADIEKFNPDCHVAKDIDVLFSGRIERRKGSRSMVEMCKRLVASRPELRICIVGYGEDEDWVRSELTAFNGNIQLTGKVPFERMMDYYNRSRLYVSTSYYEGLPGTCLEAMAMRLPVVVWDFLFYQGLVIEGQTGCLAPPNDFERMTRKVLELLDDETTAVAMGAAGRALLETRYNWRGLAEEILAALK